MSKDHEYSINSKTWSLEPDIRTSTTEMSDKNRKIRGSHRSFVKRTIHYVQETLDVFQGTAEQSEILKGYLLTLKEKKEVLQKLDEAILEAIEDGDIEGEIFEASELGLSINRSFIKIEHALKNPEMPQDNSIGTANSNQLSDTQSSPKPKEKLPKLILKKFAGETTEWKSFWDSFCTAVHNNRDVSNVDKFNYLKSFLEGTAVSAIAGLSLTEETYDSAVELLNDRFGKSQVIISSDMDSALNLEPVVNAADIKGVRQLYDEMEIHIRSLQSLGVSSESYGTLLVPVILNKTPEELRLLISRKFDKDKWEVSEVLVAFKEELEAREMCTDEGLINQFSPKG